jgi:CheY-like chemotaxis protein
LLVECRSEDSERHNFCFEISDTGIGMTPAQIDRLVTPFAQADGSTTRRLGGSGLGLTISKNLIELMGGNIGVESAFGRGSCFRIHIPCERLPDATDATDAPGDRRREGIGNPSIEDNTAGPGTLAYAPLDRGVALDDVAKPAPRPTPTGRVLLAEDNPINQKVACRMLMKLGIEPDLVGNGVEALSRLQHEHYDAVLMDMQMPILDGLDATRQWREQERLEQRPHTPIIAITANAMTGDRDACLDAGMDDYLAKPVTLADLHDTLRRWMPPI